MRHCSGRIGKALLLIKRRFVNKIQLKVFRSNCLVYTIAYGVEERKDPKEGRKVFATTMALVGVAVGLFAFIRSFGNN